LVENAATTEFDLAAIVAEAINDLFNKQGYTSCYQTSKRIRIS
jgi:hypothetical protein